MGCGLVIHLHRVGMRLMEGVITVEVGVQGGSPDMVGRERREWEREERIIGVPEGRRLSGGESIRLPLSIHMSIATFQRRLICFPASTWFRSPPVREAVLPNVNAVDEEVEGGIVSSSSQQAPLLDPTTGSTAISAPAIDLHVDAPNATAIVDENTTATITDPIRNQRQEHLRTALRALKGMYGGGEEEWDEVVREFASR
jgi:hypothetical protein